MLSPPTKASRVLCERSGLLAALEVQRSFVGSQLASERLHGLRMTVQKRLPVATFCEARESDSQFGNPPYNPPTFLLILFLRFR
jgi:hypothetical protein